jgi:hypothetical protein
MAITFVQPRKVNVFPAWISWANHLKDLYFLPDPLLHRMTPARTNPGCPLPGWVCTAGPNRHDLDISKRKMMFFE